MRNDMSDNSRIVDENEEENVRCHAESSSSNTSSSFSNFSIEHILNSAGNTCKCDSSKSVKSEGSVDLSGNLFGNSVEFSWLNCTRYCPPKIPRNNRRDVGTQKRKMGRLPRIPFTNHQILVLEKTYQKTPYLTGEQVVELAKELQLDDMRVKIWFQNRRARHRRDAQNSQKI